MAKDEEDDLSDLEFEDDDEFDPLDDESLVPFSDEEETEHEMEYETVIEEDQTEEFPNEVTDFAKENGEKEEHSDYLSPLPAEEQPISISEVPLNIIVELGTIRLPLSTILKMEPGNILPIDTDSSHVVHLTVMGKRIAKGELIKIGDNLGIRVIELGPNQTD